MWHTRRCISSNTFILHLQNAVHYPNIGTIFYLTTVAVSSHWLSEFVKLQSTMSEMFVSQRKTFPVPLNVVKSDSNCTTWTKYSDLICGKFKEEQVHPCSLSGKYCELSDNLCPCLKIGNKSFVNKAESTFEDLRMTGTVQNCVHKEISNIKFWNCYHASRIFCFPFAFLETWRSKYMEL
jgi:hypothetical protein